MPEPSLAPQRGPTSSPCSGRGTTSPCSSSSPFSASSVSAAAYWFLVLVGELQKWIFNPAYLPKALGFHGEPVWWPLPVVALAGTLVGLTIQYLPGRGGHSPADGFACTGRPRTELPGVILAALAGLALGAVIGPEAPLIAIGGGLAAGIVRAARSATFPSKASEWWPRPGASPPSALCSGLH